MNLRKYNSIKLTKLMGLNVMDKFMVVQKFGSKKAIFVFTIGIMIVLGSCTNTSLRLINADNETINNFYKTGLRENTLDKYKIEDVYFFIQSFTIFPLYYFNYLPQSNFMLKIYSKSEISNVFINSYEIEVENSDINYTSDSSIELIVKREQDNYIGLKVIRIGRILPEEYLDQKDLYKFKDYKIVTIKLHINFIRKEKTITGTIVIPFKIRIQKSNAMIDKLMSV